MPDKTFPFTASLVAGAPEHAGVFLLWRDGDVIYIGHALGGAANIRSMLVRHLAGEIGPCTRRATHYSWQISADPAALELELLHEYHARNQRLPDCNARR